MREPTDTRQWQALRRSVSDARLLGSVFIATGALLTVPMIVRAPGIIGQVLAVSASVLLIAPGVLYWIAASALRARRPSGAVLARRAAAGHLLAIAASLLLGLLAGGWNRLEGVFLAPAVVALFFVPALVAFLAQTRTAYRAAQTLDDTGRAFEPLVARPVIPPQPHSSESEERSVT